MLFTLIKRNTARKAFTHQLITGYFNAKEICWETWSTSSSDKMGQELLECIGDASLTQKVNFCTRIKEGQKDDMVQNLAGEPPLGLSDHVVVAFDFMNYYGLEDVEKVRYQYVRGDYEAMEEHVKRVNWEEVLYGKDVNGIWEVIM